MKKLLSTVLGTLLAANTAQAAMEDDPLLLKVMLEQFEIRATDGDDPRVWEAEAWLGKDLNKFWVKTEGERVGGDTEEAEVQLLYSRGIYTYWDLQIGWRHDIRPRPKRDWLVVGIKGLAPYFFDTDAALFLGGPGGVGARLQTEYELLFTQRLILTPEVEVNLHSKSDPATGTGSGLSDLELGLRLRYEIRREFAPYVGVNWWKKFGSTAGFARAEGGPTDDLQWVAGIRAWF